MPYIIAILIAVVLATGFTLLQTNQSDTEQVSTATTEVIDPNATYRDGVYIADIDYRTPEFSLTGYHMNVTLTVKGGIVTDSTIVYSGGAQKDGNTRRFEDTYKTEVIGKELKSINLSRVGGASLTTNAFNNALVEIKKQAQS